MSDDSIESNILTHGIIMSTTWFGLQNILIWSQYFKNYPYALYVHIAAAGFMALLMTSGAIVILTTGGISLLQYQYYHTDVGFGLLMLIPLILISGTVCHFSQTSPTLAPQKVYFNNKAHSLFGWFCILASKISLYSGFKPIYMPPTIIYIILDVISHSLFFYLKFYPKTMGGSSTIVQFGDRLRLISSEKQLRFYGKNYFIFTDYVYSTELIASTHPGGWKIVQEIRGREVDRFIYGMEPIQIFFSQNKAIQHTEGSLKLAGDPIAKIQIPNPYTNMDFINNVSCKSLSKLHSHADVFILFLSPTYRKCFYNGYTHLSQIGQYYALTAESKITRLYTAVNFLQENNIHLIQNTFKMVESDEKESLSKNQIVEKSQANIPLFIKKYSNGAFTSNYISDLFHGNYQMSRPRGMGLALQDMPPGKLVIFAGGTGLYPFSDLIDLLYKAMLIQSKHKDSAKFEASDPLLSSRPFKDFTFQLYLAVNLLEELHPITLQQCNRLSSQKSFKCIVKIKGLKKQTVEQKYPNIVLTDHRFEMFIKSEINSADLSQIYMCGPSRFTKSLIQELRSQMVDPNLYRII